jgi:hypothetical protein
MRRRVACHVGACVLAMPTFARAACPLELVPADAPPAWASAARAAERRLATSATEDCGSVEIAVRPSGGALLTFITTDGRRAVRALLSPEEIAPALDALLVTLPPETSPPAEPPATPSAPGEPSAPPAATPAAPATSAPEVHFIVGGSSGVRFGFGGAYLSPAFALRPSGTFGPWELAGTVEIDSSYTYLPGGVPPGFKHWSFVAGLQLGRREALGKIALGYGLGLGVAAVRQEADDGSDAEEKAVSIAQPRASLYARLVVPRSASLRATFDLGLDAALGKFRKKASLRNELPELPRWGILVTAGVETSAL